MIADVTNFSYSQLPERGILSVQGVDAISFLQGLITQDITLCQPNKMVYSCFLTPQGRYISDFFIWWQPEGVLLEMPLSHLPVMRQRLLMFRLRSKVEITDLSPNYHFFALWPNKGDAQTQWPITEGEVITGNDYWLARDPRLADMGWRLLSSCESPTILQEANMDETYSLHRLQHIVPEYPAELIPEKTLLLEANMDCLHAISWSKGCYMGQELTARTHYRGLVKKRLAGFHTEKFILSLDVSTPIMAENQEIGHILSYEQGHGIAMVKIDAWQKAMAASTIFTIDGVKTIILPPTYAHQFFGTQIF